ncbi:16123_t:CDS:1, partial [Gigaspora margarita]
MAHNIKKIIKGKKPKWFQEMGDAIRDKENPNIEDMELNPFTLKETKEEELKNGTWVLTREGIIGRVKKTKEKVVTLSHWIAEEKVIKEKCRGFVKHKATRMTAGVMIKRISDITILVVNRKRKIYGNLADITEAFKRRKKKEEGFAREIFMDKCVIRSWRFIKNFRNMEEQLLMKHEKLRYKKEMEFEVNIKKEKNEKKEGAGLTALILCLDQSTTWKVKNVTWPTEEKLVLTVLAMLIAICKEKATVRINTNSEMMQKVTQKLENTKLMKMALIKENLGQLTYAVKIMLESKRTKVEIKVDKRTERQLEVKGEK